VAIGFGATLGAGTTDKVSSALTTGSATRSYFAWINKNGLGGGNLGRVLDQATNTVQIANFDATNLFFNHSFSAAGGRWTFAAPSANTWAPLCITYDNSATTNDPIVYLSGSKLTIGSGLTEILTPVGTANSPAGSAIIVGNRSDDIRNWDGILAEFAVWDAVLSDGEGFALCKGYSPLLIRPQSLVEYLPMVRNKTSMKIAAPTVVGTAVQPHPRIIAPKRHMVNHAAAAGGLSIPVGMYQYRRQRAA
jgi:hypothetical protein